MWNSTIKSQPTHAKVSLAQTRVTAIWWPAMVMCEVGSPSGAQLVWGLCAMWQLHPEWKWNSTIKSQSTHAKDSLAQTRVTAFLWLAMVVCKVRSPSGAQLVWGLCAMWQLHPEWKWNSTIKSQSTHAKVSLAKTRVTAFLWPAMVVCEVRSPSGAQLVWGLCAV